MAIDRVAALIRPNILRRRAYAVAPPGMQVKLDAMENPYQLPESLRLELAAELAQLALNRYPEGAPLSLKRQLADWLGVDPAFELMLGNGSDELILLLAMAVAKPQAVLLAPEPSFVMYQAVAEYTGMQYVGVPLRDDFSLDLPAMQAAIEQFCPALIFLAYPNNPTGNLFAVRDIEEIIAQAPGLVVVDEAYFPFAGASFMPRLADFDHLLVLRTLSKIGLAGIRVGALAGSAQWLHEIDKLRLPYNINVLSQAVLEFACRHPAVFEQQARQICLDREHVLQQLRAAPDFQVFSSAANFLLLRVATGQAKPIWARLQQHGVLIKLLDGVHPLLTDCLRLTIGTPEENTRCLELLSAAAIA